MKKFALCALFALFSATSFAGIDQGIDAGMTHISLLGGFASPIASYSYTPPLADAGLDYGDAGCLYGLQFIEYLTPHFGLGAEFTGADYTNSEYTIASGGAQDKYTSSAKRYAVMFAGKFIFKPEAKTRIYIPVGAGFSRFKGKVRKSGTLTAGTGTVQNSSTEPAIYAGIGVETDLNDIFIFGIESRYNMFWVDENKFYNTDYLTDMSLLFKVGIKF